MGSPFGCHSIFRGADSERGSPVSIREVRHLLVPKEDDSN